MKGRIDIWRANIIWYSFIEHLSWWNCYERNKIKFRSLREAELGSSAIKSKTKMIQILTPGSLIGEKLRVSDRPVLHMLSGPDKDLYKCN